MTRGKEKDLKTRGGQEGKDFIYSKSEKKSVVIHEFNMKIGTENHVYSLQRGRGKEKGGLGDEPPNRFVKKE